VKELLKKLFCRLEAIGEQYPELYDSDVSEAMTEAIRRGYFNLEPAFAVSDDLGMSTGQANQLVKGAIKEFIDKARALAEAQGLDFRSRVAEFQRLDTTVGDKQICYNDFFRYTRISG
jgi:hypothetical protein